MVVREDADRRPLVDRSAGEELVRPLDDQLVDVGEALPGDELRAGVADGHPEAEELADLGHGGGVVDRAEDVHRRPRGEGGDEELSLGRVHDPRLAAGEELRGGAVVVGADEPFRAGFLAGDPDLEGDRPLLADGLGDRGDELGIEPVDEDVHRAAAREADLEGLLVGDAVRLQARITAREHLAGLAVDGRLDAPACHGADDVAALGDGQHGARLARRRALGVDHGRDRHGRAVGGPALERLEDVPHDARRPRYRSGSASNCARQCAEQK